ncbi:MAG: acyl-CoA/acyl-ACP dehydrogenase [Deltaproteobacteria bacterium]|nr:acyl-CoA/acyl-ACP dehydrogenase [Deltaproteobacteria bacterium]
MDFELTMDQKMIRQLAVEFFEKEYPMEKTRALMADPAGYDPKLWEKMVQLGHMGLIIPEVYGGSEGDLLELALFVEEMGKQIVPSPFFTTVCQCVPALLAYGTEEQKKARLPKIATRGEIWSLALNEQRGDFSPQDVRLSATANGEGFVLNGTKLFVPYAGAADHLLVAARMDPKGSCQDGITVFMVKADAPGIHISEIPTPAPGVKCEVRFDNAVVSRQEILGAENAGWQIVEHILQYGGLLKAAEMSGGLQVALDLALKYAKQRVQFDKPIISFQVIQHDLVKMLIEVDNLKHLVYEAAWNISIDKPSRLLNSMAKAKANDIYHRICFDAIGIHGAIGWTEEMDVSLYLLRSKDLENDCGGSDFHMEQVARELERRDPDFLAI